ncbi:TetR/AcrR family transcriptional regulator [Myceligenerans salitolerans]|uniref:TetR/AcrR family transcriptional regulator n=1 Tax=Myceligenerans salitolerans TaxID=1230528 RepID=A0ABS3I795_9MICO|nr:TetR/AcrR family transcriptional regulator [Myceligenerans salitolerans]MBO0608491.1 TetR/AcrR family transcriptional regulator [Myceligenerans salitolerans]
MPRVTARPRREPNPATPAGEKVLAVAAELFYANGIRAVGVDRIADEAGVTKKTLYDRFGSKDALVAAYLRRREAIWRKHLHERLEASGTTGRERLLTVLDIAADWAERNRRGCAFVNAHAEIGGTDHPGNAVIREDKAYMLRLFVDLAEKTLGDGTGPVDGRQDPATIGRQIHLMYEGALTAHTTGVQPEAFLTARAAAAALLAR